MKPKNWLIFVPAAAALLFSACTAAPAPQESYVMPKGAMRSVGHKME